VRCGRAALDAAAAAARPQVMHESLSARLRLAAEQHAAQPNRAAQADQATRAAQAAQAAQAAGNVEQEGRRASESVADGAISSTLRLRDLLHLHGDDSAAVLLLVLSVLCVTPVAGIGTMVGFVMLAIAWRWGHANTSHPLPDRLAAVSMNEKWSRRSLHFLAWLYAKADRHLRPRWAALFHRGANVLWGVWIALMALLIMLPLPLGNVLPALSLVLLSLAWMFRDGLLLLLSALPGVGGWVLAYVFGDVVLSALQTAVQKATALVGG